MNKLILRWRALAPREQWLAYLVGLTLLIMLYVLMVAEPLSLRIAAEKQRDQLARTRQVEAQNSVLAIQAKLAADPNLSYQQALAAVKASHDGLLERIDLETGALVSPANMKTLLQDLLRNQTQLKLISLESSSAPLAVPVSTLADPGAHQALPVLFYRHGLRLTLEGGYFELLTYLNAIQASGWRLHWDSLDYEVGEGGARRARIILNLHTLSRDAGWVGV